MDAEKFGAFVAQCRREKNWTQAELAAKLQVTDKAVSRWERGRGFPDIQLLLPLANALGVSVLELMRSEKMEEEKRTSSLDDQAAAELLAGAVEMERKNRRQDRAATAIAAAVKSGKCKAGEDITVKVKGGDLTVNYTEERIILTGNAVLVYNGVTEY